ncbi:MAG TPA: (d)CMP kinase [Actinomycetota bacterium]|nr:(d)CMP kinase [Actinomycetota bacterium]
MTVIAIDGPAGAGKSSVARAVARALCYSYLDTGAMYRAVALAVLEQGVDPTDESAVAALTATVEVDARGETTMLNGRDVGQRIRDEDVTSIVSLISSYPMVRSRLLQLQRQLLAQGDIVVEGRDIGTRVAPDADAKVYLTASLEQRARRRATQYGAETAELSKFETDLEKRDRADSGRRESPLTQAQDSVVIDSTDLSLEQVVEQIVELIKAREP